jgi:hypothetical protein
MNANASSQPTDRQSGRWMTTFEGYRALHPDPNDNDRNLLFARPPVFSAARVDIRVSSLLKNSQSAA